jgi:3-oxoacyl-[acyl-carrier protein] reductase
MKIVLLIGASGGIGNKVAAQLLEEGYSVIGTFFQHPERIENLKEIKNFFDAQVNVQLIDSVKALQQMVVKNRNYLYAVINCSGIVEFEGDSTENDFDIWKRTISTNLSGNYYLAKIFYKSLSRNGRFIMISSTDAAFGGAITASYAASKAGINSLTKSLSLLLKEKKIRVNSIAPGWVVTPMIEVNGDKFLDKAALINPLGRNAKPIDVGNLISFLLSEKSNYINGQVISLDGGYTNQDPTLLLEEEIQV